MTSPDNEHFFSFRTTSAGLFVIEFPVMLMNDARNTLLIMQEMHDFTVEQNEGKFCFSSKTMSERFLEGLAHQLRGSRDFECTKAAINAYREYKETKPVTRCDP